MERRKDKGKIYKKISEIRKEVNWLKNGKFQLRKYKAIKEEPKTIYEGTEWLSYLESCW